MHGKNSRGLNLGRTISARFWTGNRQWTAAYIGDAWGGLFDLASGTAWICVGNGCGHRREVVRAGM